jgi:hypothetical protein
MTELLTAPLLNLSFGSGHSDFASSVRGGLNVPSIARAHAGEAEALNLALLLSCKVGSVWMEFQLERVYRDVHVYVVVRPDQYVAF